MGEVRREILLGLLVLPLIVAGRAEATWQLYGSADIGYSIGIGDYSGESDLVGQSFGGSDQDVSILLRGAFGVQIPMDELTPWRMPGEMRLPDWPVRFDIEFAGLRDYDFKTPGQDTGTPAFHTHVESWSMLFNTWLDIPLQGVYRPISSVSRVVAKRQRLPGLKRFLRPASLFMGVGIGFNSLKTYTTDAVLTGVDERYNFAYQAGVGFGYQLTDRVNLSLGYHYYNPGKASGTLWGSAPDQDDGHFRLDSDIHEIAFGLRILLYDLPYPWR